MTLAEAWRALQRERFPELPLDCGNAADPGVIYSDDLRDWSDKATTPDQGRMEKYIDRYDLRQKRVLHIGIGNSGFAERFHRRTGEIVGTTIDEPEIQVARKMGSRNYRFVLQNKYKGDERALPGNFDFILDNNPSSPCCCIRHLAILFELYSGKLTAGGQIVTDREGLEWVPASSNPRWSFSFDDFAAAGSIVGLSAFRANSTVFVLSRTPPPDPGWRALIRHRIRRAGGLPARLLKHAPSALRSFIRRSLLFAATRGPASSATGKQNAPSD